MTADTDDRHARHVERATAHLSEALGIDPQRTYQPIDSQTIAYYDCDVSFDRFQESVTDASMELGEDADALANKRTRGEESTQGDAWALVVETYTRLEDDP